MERGEGLPSSVEGLRVEVLRLRQELEQTSQEKIQAAEYGLQVLEEKQLILQQYEDLEALFEVTNRELDLAKELPLGVCLLVPVLSEMMCKAKNLELWKDDQKEPETCIR